MLSFDKKVVKCKNVTLHQCDSYFTIKLLFFFVDQITKLTNLLAIQGQ